MGGNNVLTGYHFRTAASPGVVEGRGIPSFKKVLLPLDGGGGGWVDAAGVLDGWLLVCWLVECRGVKVRWRSLVISNLVLLVLQH